MLLDTNIAEQSLCMKRDVKVMGPHHSSFPIFHARDAFMRAHTSTNNTAAEGKELFAQVKESSRLDKRGSGLVSPSARESGKLGKLLCLGQRLSWCLQEFGQRKLVLILLYRRSFIVHLGD